MIRPVELSVGKEQTAEYTQYCHTLTNSPNISKHFRSKLQL